MFVFAYFSLGDDLGSDCVSRVFLINRDELTDIIPSQRRTYRERFPIFYHQHRITNLR